MKRNLITAIVVVVLVVLLAASWGFGLSGVREERAEAERAWALSLEATREADSIRESYRALREESVAKEAKLERDKIQAQKRAELAETELAHRTAEAERTGEVLRQTILEALAGWEAGSPPSPDELMDALDDYSEGVRLERVACRTTISEMQVAMDASEGVTGLLRGRVEVAEQTIEARDVECRLCREEADLFRELDDPGFFERIRRGLGWLGSGIITGAVLTVAVLG